MDDYSRISRTQARTLFRKYGTVYIKIDGKYEEVKEDNMEKHGRNRNMASYGRHCHAFSLVISELLKTRGKKKFEYYELQSTSR